MRTQGLGRVGQVLFPL